MKLPRHRIVVYYDHLKPYHGQRESSTPAPPETITLADQSDPVTLPDYEDESVFVHLSPPVQTSPELSLRRSSRIRRPPDHYGDPVAH